MKLKFTEDEGSAGKEIWIQNSKDEKLGCIVEDDKWKCWVWIQMPANRQCHHCPRADP